MSRKKTIALLFLLGIVLISNIPMVKFSVGLDGIGKSYAYSTANNNFSFREIPTKGRDLDMMKRQFEHFKSKTVNESDTVLYRDFKKQYIQFWNWGEYLFHERWRYPLKE